MLKRWRLYAGITAIFALGGVAGTLLGVTAERNRQRQMEKDGPLPILENLTNRLENDLKLDPRQVQQVRQVYADTRPQLQQLERERRRRLRQLFEGTLPEIMKVLTPPQRERFQQLQQKIQARLRLREPEPPRPPNPGAPVNPGT